MTNLEIEKKSCWELYTDSKDRAGMNALADRYIHFLSTCKTERETIDFAREQLKKAGFSDGVTGDRALFTLHKKTLFAARRGKQPLSKGQRLVCAHADTPRLDLKQRPLLEQAHVGQAKTHYYGGIRKYQWLARPLALHGVVVRRDGSTVALTIGEDPADPVFTIADLLPHLAQSQADQPISKVFEGERLNLAFGHEPKPTPKGKKAETPKEPVKAHILALLNERYGLVEEDLYTAELQAVPAGPARYVGLDRAMIGGYGQDDRICVFTGMNAFLESVKTKPEHTAILMLWDKEEIGSEGSTGAKSRFFEYCMQDLIAAWEPKARFSDVLRAAQALSADVHAAVDPDWQELHEKNNAAWLGFGPCFCKFTGHRGKYEANDAHAEYVGVLRNLLNAHKVPWQMAELGKVDGGGGGTVAMHLAAYGMNIIDFGPPVLSMHSPFELSSKADLYATLKAYATFYRS